MSIESDMAGAIVSHYTALANVLDTLAEALEDGTMPTDEVRDELTKLARIQRDSATRLTERVG